MGRDVANAGAMFCGLDSNGKKTWDLVYGHGAYGGNSETHIASVTFTHAKMIDFHADAVTSFLAFDAAMTSDAAMLGWWASLPGSARHLVRNRLKDQPI